MSEKKRRKKDGENQDKDRQAMRESVKQRHETAATSRAGEGGHPDRLEGHDHDNIIGRHKPGTESDRNFQKSLS